MSCIVPICVKCYVNSHSDITIGLSGLPTLLLSKNHATYRLQMLPADALVSRYATEYLSTYFTT